MQQSITGNPDGSVTFSGNISTSGICSSSTTTYVDTPRPTYGDAVEIGREIKSDRIEFVYKQERQNVLHSSWSIPPPETIVLAFTSFLTDSSTMLETQSSSLRFKANLIVEDFIPVLIISDLLDVNS